MSKDTERLNFLIENRVRVEKWNVSPIQERYFVYDDDDELIADELTGRRAIDKAMKHEQFK